MYRSVCVSVLDLHGRDDWTSEWVSEWVLSYRESESWSYFWKTTLLVGSIGGLPTLITLSFSPSPLHFLSPYNPSLLFSPTPISHFISLIHSFTHRWERPLSISLPLPLPLSSSLHRSRLVLWDGEDQGTKEVMCFLRGMLSGSRPLYQIYDLFVSIDKTFVIDLWYHRFDPIEI